MPQYNLKDIAEIISGKFIGNENPVIRYLVIDSRNLISPADSLFFAIKGERHNGHQYIEELSNKKNLKNFVVNYIDRSWKKINANFIVVDDSVLAIQKLAAWHREQFKGNIIGITGSNGKTIVKEWLYQLLHQDKTIIRSPKSFNSQVGVPLSVWNLESNADMAIFEAGISKPFEMERLEAIIKPDIGIFTNIGEAHQENFSSVEEKIKEKMRLFKNARVLIYCNDYELLSGEIQKSAKKEQILLNWSLHNPATLKIIKITEENNKTKILADYLNKSIYITIPFTDKGSIENSIHCWMLMLYMGYDNETIKNRMQELLPIAMRLELKKGINNCTIINDSYNSDIHSLDIALDFLNQQNQNTDKTLILSDILQSGKSENDLYNEVNRLLINKKINRLVGIGSALYRNAGIFSCEKNFSLTTDDFIKQLKPESFRNEAILLKGARSFEFERILSILELKAHQTILEINLSAMIHNLNYFRSKLKPETKIVVMVKAFSYGSGSFEIANMLEYQKADYLAVAFADEGVTLRQAGISLPIIIMNPEENSFRQMIEYRLEPEIYSFNELDQFTTTLKAFQVEEFPVHLKLDSGMHRLGFDESDMDSLLNNLKLNKNIRVHSVFSHLSASDEPQHDKFTRLQIKRFNEMYEKLKNSFDKPVIRHILNSMGIERFPEAQFEMVRLGIGLYGINPFNQDLLRNVSSLKSTISQVKTVAPGETIGYGRKGFAEKELKIAVIPVGYADGFDRRLGNGIGQIWIKGFFVPLIGNVCMDMCMADVTGFDVNEGDEVEIFGEHISISEIAERIGTIPYEILTGISSRVKRVYIQE